MIDSNEQYEAALTLMELAMAMGVVGAEKMRDNFICNYSDEWSVCNYCYNLMSDCECHHNDNDCYDEDDYGCRCNNPDGKCYC